MSIAYIVCNLDGKLRSPIYNMDELVIKKGMALSIPLFVNGTEYFSNGVIRLYTNSVLAMLNSMDVKSFGQIRIFRVEANIQSSDPRKPFCVAAKTIEVLEEIKLPLTIHEYNIVTLNIAYNLAKHYTGGLEIDFKEWINDTKGKLVAGSAPCLPEIKPNSSTALISWCFKSIYDKDYSSTVALVNLDCNIDLVKEVEGFG